MTGAHRHVVTEMVGNSFGARAFSNGLFVESNPTMREARNLARNFASESAGAVDRSNANDQAEIGQLNAMSTPEFAGALRGDPSLARHLPQMSAGSPARQEFESFVASQPPMSREAAVDGFYGMVRQSVINESLRDAGLIKEKPADAVEAEPDFGNITGINLSGPASIGAGPVLPRVELNTLAHLFQLAPGKDMAGLMDALKGEYSTENLDFVATGAALLTFENAPGMEVPADFSLKSGGPTVTLKHPLPIVRQRAEQFVGSEAPAQVNVAYRQAAALQQALANLPEDAAAATDAQRSALTTAMAECLGEIVSVIRSDSLPRYNDA
jgi:hypothetical protein